MSLVRRTRRSRLARSWRRRSPQVDDQNGKLAARRSGCSEGRPHPAVQEGTVRQPGEVVVQRAVFRPLAFLDGNTQEPGLDVGTEGDDRGQDQEGAEVRTVPAEQQRTRAGDERAADDDRGQSGLQEGRREDHRDHIEDPEVGVNPAAEEHGRRDHEDAADRKRQHEHQGSPPFRQDPGDESANIGQDGHHPRPGIVDMQVRAQVVAQDG